MKKINLIPLLLSFTLSVFTLSAESAIASQDDRAALVLKALNNPANPTAVMLKAALSGSKAVQLQIDPETIAIEELATDSYKVEFTLTHPNSEEMVLVTVDEVLVQKDQGYVFSFNVSRSMRMRKHPGVSMGNR